MGGRDLRHLWIAPAIVAAALAAVMLDGEAGLRSWLRLRGDLRAAETRIETLRAEITALEQESDELVRIFSAMVINAQKSQSKPR